MMAAIANNSVSKRTVDINEYWSTTANPISKVGVFPYAGRQVGPQFDPDEIVMVYRPAEELSDPACIESFKLLPLIDEHAMLGSELNGLLPPERKGVLGVIGEDVYFEGEYLKANLKFFAENIKNLIENGKKELSAGYRCVYEIASGVYNGVKYQAIQRSIRGNHLALVEEGRMGPDVAVLDDFRFTVDNLEFTKMGENEEVKKTNADESAAESAAERETEKSLMDRIRALEDIVHGLETKLRVTDSDGEEEAQLDVKDKEFELGSKDKEVAVDGDVIDKASCDTDKKEGMDARLKRLEAKANNPVTLKAIMSEVSRRDALASDLSKVVGTFDHADKTEVEVAKYGLDKLGIKATAGHEVSVLNAFLAGRKAGAPATHATDSRSRATGEFSMQSIIDEVKI